jgi:hypothetical protein
VYLLHLVFLKFSAKEKSKFIRQRENRKMRKREKERYNKMRLRSEERK